MGCLCELRSFGRYRPLEVWVGFWSGWDSLPLLSSVKNKCSFAIKGVQCGCRWGSSFPAGGDAGQQRGIPLYLLLISPGLTARKDECFLGRWDGTVVVPENACLETPARSPGAELEELWYLWLALTSVC